MPSDITHLWNLGVVLPLMEALKWLASISASGGLAIVLMTLIVKTVLLPLSVKQTASMKAMQALQPELAALKKKYKEREKVTQETMKLYKERGINPASGCVPMIPTMIVLIGLYGALIQLAQCDEARDPVLQCDERFQQPFLWVSSLDHPDVFHIADLALPGILPIFMAITQFFSSKMMAMPTQDPQQQTMNRMMTIMMPGMMLFWGITFPAGLVLYWFISNVYEMVRLYFTMGPQSLNMGFSFSSLIPGRAPSPSGNGVQPGEDTRQADIPAGEARPDGRPARRRQKRGRRSGRR